MGFNRVVGAREEQYKVILGHWVVQERDSCKEIVVKKAKSFGF